MSIDWERMDANLQKPIVDVASLSLDEWLTQISVHPDEREMFVADFRFPTQAHRDEYLRTIHERSESDVKDLLRRFLMIGGRLGCDDTALDYLFESGRIISVLHEVEHVKRLLVADRDPWEGNTWILDLLPLWPQMAIDAIHAYIAAHCQFMPDGRWDGHTDAIAMIRARYLEMQHPEDVLLHLTPRDFELYIAALYKRMGYEIKVTPATRDGGYDFAAERTGRGGSERLVIECKRYIKPVRVATIRQLYSVVERLTATKGVVVTTSNFTRDARTEGKACGRIELIAFPDLNRLLNEHFGAVWPNHIDGEVRGMQRETERQLLGRAA
jgi:restriction system protein